MHVLNSNITCNNPVKICTRDQIIISKCPMDCPQEYAIQNFFIFQFNVPVSQCDTYDSSMINFHLEKCQTTRYVIAMFLQCHCHL